MPALSQPLSAPAGWSMSHFFALYHHHHHHHRLYRSALSEPLTIGYQAGGVQETNCCVSAELTGLHVRLTMGFIYI